METWLTMQSIHTSPERRLFLCIYFDAKNKWEMVEIFLARKYSK